MVAVMHRALDRQAFQRQAFPDHVAGHLMLEAVHALVEIARGPIRPFALGLSVIPAAGAERCTSASRPRRPSHTSAPLCKCRDRARHRARNCSARAISSADTVSFSGQDARQPDLKRPALSENLVNLATRAGIDGVEMLRVNLVDEILAIEKLARQGSSARSREFPGIWRQSPRHRLRRPFPPPPAAPPDKARSATPPARTNRCQAYCAGCPRSGRRRCRPWR